MTASHIDSTPKVREVCRVARIRHPMGLWKAPIANAEQASLAPMGVIMRSRILLPKFLIRNLFESFLQRFASETRVTTVCRTDCGVPYLRGNYSTVVCAIHQRGSTSKHWGNLKRCWVYQRSKLGGIPVFAICWSGKFLFASPQNQYCRIGKKSETTNDRIPWEPNTICARAI